jgi:tetratricopeptide (TPR) repeat protein
LSCTGNTDKTYVQAYVNLATLHRMQGDKDKAIEVAKKGIEANPSNIVLNELYVSMLLDEKGSEAYKKAVENLRNLDPNDPLLESLENN